MRADARSNGNRIENRFFGIYLANVTDCRVMYNVVRGTATRETEAGNGIHLWTSRRITIIGNEISGHRDGIYFEFVHDSEITGNIERAESALRAALHVLGRVPSTWRTRSGTTAPASR